MQSLKTHFERDLTPADRILSSGQSLAFGMFRATPSDSAFSGSSDLSCYYFVFPRTSSEIRLDRGPTSVLGPNNVVFYNPGDSYRRYAVSPVGDRSDYIAVTPSYLQSLCREQGRAQGRISQDVFFSHLTAIQPHSLFMRQRRLFNALILDAQRPTGDMGDHQELKFEEETVSLIMEILEIGGLSELPTCPGARLRQREVVEEAKRFIGRNFRERLTLDLIAANSMISAGYLARAFRRQTGFPMHAYIMQLRLRESLELLLEMPRSITDVAAQLGFTHHSHFTMAFRSIFGITPSMYIAAPETNFQSRAPALARR